MGLQTRNEFACGRNGRYASNSMYIFSCLHQSHQFLIFRLSCKAFVVFCILFFIIFCLILFRFVCTSVLHTSYKFFVRTWNTASKYQSSGPSCLKSHRRADQRDVKGYVLVYNVHTYIHTCTIRSDDLQITSFHL